MIGSLVWGDQRTIYAGPDLIRRRTARSIPDRYGRDRPSVRREKILWQNFSTLLEEPVRVPARGRQRPQRGIIVCCTYVIHRQNLCNRGLDAIHYTSSHSQATDTTTRMPNCGTGIIFASNYVPISFREKKAAERRGSSPPAGIRWAAGDVLFIHRWS